MQTVEESFEKFQKNFESVTLTLIAQMNKISELLSRVSEAMDLTDKIKIQNVENKQIITQLDKQIKALMGRLERMSRGGFEIPEAPLKAGESPAPVASGPSDEDMEALLNASYSGAPSPPSDVSSNGSSPPSSPSNPPPGPSVNVSGANVANVEEPETLEEEPANLDEFNALLNAQHVDQTADPEIPKELMDEIAKNEANASPASPSPPQTPISLAPKSPSSTSSAPTSPPVSTLPNPPAPPVTSSPSPSLSPTPSPSSTPAAGKGMKPSGWEKIPDPGFPKAID